MKRPKYAPEDRDAAPIARETEEFHRQFMKDHASDPLRTPEGERFRSGQLAPMRQAKDA